MDKESLTEKLLDLVEGRETPESWRNWWDEHETELEALLSRGEFLKLKPCRHGFQWVPVFGSQKRAIAILEKSGTAFEASNLYQERYLAELDAFCKEQERVQREKQKEFKANNPELFGRYPKFSKALAKVLDPSDEIKPAATEEQIGNQESVLDFTLPSQVREFFLLTAGINVCCAGTSGRIGDAPTLSRLIPDEKPTKSLLPSDFASAILSTVAGMRKNE